MANIIVRSYPRPTDCDFCGYHATVWVPDGTEWKSYCKEHDPYCDWCIQFIWDCTCGSA